jgi:NAD(P)-dependent dehydrogenase (short-subunit alcohol dehydrogenase family)
MVSLDQFSLAGRTALVTGASRGIGAATARALDRAGARVGLVARSRDGLADVARALEHDPVVVVADLGDPDAPQAVARQALDASAPSTSWSTMRRWRPASPPLTPMPG